MKVINLKSRTYSLLLLTLACAFLVVGQASAENPDLAKVIDSGLITKANQGETVDIIVLLTGYDAYVGNINADDQAQMTSIQSQINAQQEVVLNNLSLYPFKLRHRFANILGFSGSIDKDGLLALAAMPAVALIEEDEKVEAHLAQGIPLMDASDARSNYDGTGVSVAIADTGIDYTHAMLGGGGFPNSKVIGGYDFGDNDANPMDCHGHGTSVAGISAGTLSAGPGDYIGGVAHNAKLYALKIVAGCAGSASSSTIAASWDWAVTHKNDDPSNPILIINTSFGGSYYTASCDAAEPTYAAAANNAVANGITLFCSSGNNGFTNGISAPACVTNSLAIGAVYDANLGAKYWGVCTDLTTAPDQVICYSNSANFLDLLGPSNDAYTTAVGGGYNSTFGGTSAASPYSAGAGALLQNYAKSTTGSYYTPAELKTLMADNGDLIYDPKSGVTTPRVNVGNASGASLLPGILPILIPQLIEE